MALDPNAFGPNAGNENTQESSRKRRVSALMGGRPSLGSLYSGDDSSGDGLSKSPLNEGDTSSSLATPNLSGAAPGAPSLLSSERVGRAPSQYSAMPVLGAADRADAAFGEAERGEEGVLGGGTKPGLSTGDRNRALMSFFHPQQAAQQSAAEPSDAEKAVGATSKAKSAGSKLKSLFSTPTDMRGLDINLFEGAPAGTTAPSTPNPNNYPDVEGEVPEQAAAGMSDVGSFGDRFKAPDFGSAGTYGTGLGAAGSLMSLLAAIKQDEDLKKAGQATSAAGSVVNAGNTLASGGEVGGGAGGYLSAATRLGTGAYGISQMDNASDSQKALQALHEASMAVADFYSGGLAELAPMIASYLPTDGVEGWIGASMMGGPGLANYSDESVQTRKRNAAQRMADKETQGLHQLFSQIPQGNMGQTYAALRAKLDPRGAVRSELNPQAAKELGLSSGQWGDMSPEQFQAVMEYLKADPSRLSSIRGSGDVGYLPQYEAGQTALQNANSARSLLARQLGLQYTPEETDDQRVMRGFQEQYAAQQEQKAREASLKDLFATGPAGGN